MSVLQRSSAVVAIVLTFVGASPVYAQQTQQQRQFQQQRHSQQPRPPQQQNRPQEAQRRHGGNGAGVAAGVIGGLAAGALLGGVLSGRSGPAEPAYDGEVEGGPGAGYGGGCPTVRQPVYDGAGVFVGYQAVPSC